MRVSPKMVPSSATEIPKVPNKAESQGTQFKQVITDICKGIRMIIRNETESDFEAISIVTETAFRTLPVSNHTEQFIIKALRKAKALNVSLVAEIDGQVVGHIAFSPVTVSDGSLDWHGLGPLSVLPEYQKQGIGGALVNEGLSRLKALGSRGCVLVGYPAFYQRFGFRNTPSLIYAGIPQEFFQVLPFDTEIPRGSIVFHEGFSAKPDTTAFGHS